MERKKSWENKFPPPMNRACYSNLDTMGELSDSPFNGKPAKKYRNICSNERLLKRRGEISHIKFLTRAAFYMNFKHTNMSYIPL